MNDISEQRPDFFEGEYLAAADLEQLVIYLRDQSARHALGGHAWGIVAGLQLVEQASPRGGTDIYLLPGYAVDGYGRPVTVLNPVLLTPDIFTGQPAGTVPLWLHYDQSSTQGVRPGFQVCNAGDSYTRVAESYALKTGLFSGVQSQSGITIAGEAVPDPRLAPRLFDDNGPVICDGSVPYQDLPLADETKSTWRIPLGLVGWLPGPPTQFAALSAADRVRSRRLRRYLGVVAENVFAADGLIRLRRRTTDLPAGQTDIDQLCGAGDVSNASYDGDIALCSDGPRFNELVWIEGRLRVTDDTRIAGGRLELRDAAGTDYLPQNQPGSVPLLLQRTDRGTNADLEVLIGTAQSGANRLLIQQAGTPTTDPTDPCNALHFDSAVTKVAVLDSGNVGIGTASPDELLEIEGDTPSFLHVSLPPVPSDIYVGAAEDGGVVATLGTNDLRIRTGGAVPTDDSFTRVTVATGGQVGVGTTAPDTNRLVTLEAKSAAYLIARTTQGPHEVLLGANGNGAVLAANTPGDDLVLGANGNSPTVWVKSTGQIGVNTSAPDRDVTVQGAATAYINARASQGNHQLLIGADSTGTMVSAMSGDDLQLRSGGNINQVNIKANGNVGIGTDWPNNKLDVRGSIALGDNGQYFAPAGLANWVIIAGTVDASGAGQLGGGFAASYNGILQQYWIAFTVPLSGSPVVTVTPLGLSPASPLVLSTSTAGFVLQMWDGAPTQTAFSFIALAAR